MQLECLEGECNSKPENTYEVYPMIHSKVINGKVVRGSGLVFTTCCVGRVELGAYSAWAETLKEDLAGFLIIDVTEKII
tara:strand:+ start:12530 stop:12766 length:237 start_codon:yes stop_codon:yes gene_type:complete